MRALAWVSQLRTWWTGGVVLTLVATAVLSSNVPETRFFGDEAGWIRAGYQTADLFLDGDFGPAELSTVGYSYGNFNPQLGKLLLGIPLVLYSDHFLDGARFVGTYFKWRSPESYENKVAKGEAPPREILELGRSISAFYGVLCVLMVSGFVWRFFGGWVGLLAGALLLTTPVFVEASTRSMTDVEYNLLLVAGLPLMARILNSPSRRSDLVLAALFGLVAGVASSIKISGLPLFGLAYVLLLAIRELQDRRGLRRLAENCALFVLVGVSCIYALNPFYWPEVSKIHPSAAAREARALLFEGKRVELGAPFLVYAGARYDRRRIIEQFPQLYNLLRPLEFPAHYLRWNTDQTLQASRHPWPGQRLQVIARRLFIDFTSFPMEWIFLLWGAASCWARVVAEWRAGRVSPYLVPLFWFALNLAIVLLAVRVYGDRYFLPTVIAERILVAVGLWSALGWLRDRFGTRFQSATAAAPAGDDSGATPP